MTKVWVVYRTDGFQGEYIHIIAMFDSKEKAEDYRQKHDFRAAIWGYDLK